MAAKRKPGAARDGDVAVPADVESLATYNAKRRFDETPEPPGTATAEDSREPIFVIQMHHASRLHFDFRVEADGVLKSWAVPKGPTLDTREKRFAVRVEDHPFDYRDFEGIIPKGNYGAGEVIVWDRGTYRLLEGTDAAAQIEKGSLKIELHGKKLQGGFALVRIKGRNGEENAWLLIKERDAFVDPSWRIEDHADSVTSGKTLQDLARDPRAPHSTASKAAKPKPVASPKAVAASKETAPSKAPAVPSVAATPSVLPPPFEPMLASSVERPFDDDRYLYEIKWDGYRALARIEADGSMVLQSRGGIDFAPKFDEFADLPSAFSERPVIVDGEICVLDERGFASFEALQQRLDRFGRRSDGHGATFVAFDCLFANGRDLRERPLEERKAILEGLLTGRGAVMLSKHVERAGIALFEVARTQHLEGIIAKRRDSPYRSRRTRDWLKMKTALRQEFVIGGWTEGRASRKHFGALVLGVYRGEDLVPVGTVGSGFDARSLQAIALRLAPLERHGSPFVPVPKTDTKAHWTSPELVAEVSFAEWTRDGVLRQPTFVALRDDKNPRTIVREYAVSPEVALAEPSATVADPAAVAESEAVVPAAAASAAAAPAGSRAADASATAGAESVPERAMRARRTKSVGVPQAVRVGERTLSFTNRDKLLFPEDGITKGDLIEYYRAVAPWILPHVAQRPLTVERFPDGIAAPAFFEKHKPRGAPPWIATVTLPSDGRQSTIDYVLCNDEATLAYCANLGAIVLHVWTSHVPALDEPEFVFFDLDPWEGCRLATLGTTALGLRDLLTEIGLSPLVKTSGGTGLHVVVPLEAGYTYDAAKIFAEIVARKLHERLPEATTLERATKARPHGTVYLDYVQVGRGKTLVSAYSVRAKPGAPVSMPIPWSEVEAMAASPDADATAAFGRYTLRTVPALLERHGDAWDRAHWPVQRLEPALERARTVWAAGGKAASPRMTTAGRRGKQGSLPSEGGT